MCGGTWPPNQGQLLAKTDARFLLDGADDLAEGLALPHRGRRVAVPSQGVHTVGGQVAEALLERREGGAGVIAEAMLPKMLAPGAPEALVARVRALMAATPVPGIVGALGAMRDRPDSTSLLPTLAGLPALVIAGGSDQLMPVSEMSAMAAAIPGARLVVAPGAGHLPTLETPSVVTDTLRTFLAQAG